MADKNVNGIVGKLTLKPRDDAFNQKMNEYHAKRKALLDANPSKYLKPEWDSLRDEMQKFRSGYEKPQVYSLREYLLDNDPDEFQIDQVRDDLDFNGLLDEMKKGKDFYEAASVGGKGFDSAVREKLFNGLVDNVGGEYDDYYNLWLNGTPIEKSIAERKLAQSKKAEQEKKRADFKKHAQEKLGAYGLKDNFFKDLKDDDYDVLSRWFEEGRFN